MTQSIGHVGNGDGSNDAVVTDLWKRNRRKRELLE